MQKMMVIIATSLPFYRQHFRGATLEALTPRGLPARTLMLICRRDRQRLHEDMDVYRSADFYFAYFAFLSHGRQS